MPDLTIATLQRALKKLERIQERTGQPVLMTPRYIHLRNSETRLTIESVKPYVKVSAIIGPSNHKQLKQLAAERKTTIGVLVAEGVRLLLASPAVSKNLPLDGRRAS